MTPDAVPAGTAWWTGASTLAERMQAPASAAADPAGEATLARWQRLVAEDDPVRFARRLDWDRWNTEALMRRPVDAAPPPWARWIVDAYTPATSDTSARIDAAAIPFGDLLRPLVTAAVATMRTTNGASLDQALGADATNDLERGLHRQLGDVCGHALMTLCDAFRDSTSTGNDRYDAFVQSARGGDDAWFVRLPALARLAAERARLWAESVGELAARAVADQGAIGERFGHGAGPGQIVAVDPDRSDSHHGGRTVAVVTFASGLRLVYKPRSLAMESGFAATCRWLDERGGGFDLRAPEALDRGTHGWMALVTAAPCTDAAAVQRYWRRAGAMTCLAYVLSGEDLHSGNVIAAGEWPAFLDLEVLLGPAAPYEGFGGGPALQLWQRLRESVLATALLPQLYLGPGGVGYAEGGLAAPTPGGNTTIDRWTGLGTDAMSVVAETVPRADTAHLPSIDGVAQVPHRRAFSAGFVRAYDVLTANREALAAAIDVGGAFEMLAEASTRVVLRATSIYAVVLRRSLRSDAARSGTRRSVEIDVLRRPALRSTEPHRLWPAFDAESRALERGDIPAFHVPVAGRSLMADGVACVRDYVAVSGRDRMLARIGALGRADLTRQRHLMRIAWASHDVRLRRPTESPTDPARAALDVAELLSEIATRTRRGVTWWTIDPTHGAVALGPGLGTGAAGIALFFAALVARQTGNSERTGAWAALARAAFAHALPPAGDRRLTATLGAASGLGGAIYALAAASRWLDAPELLDRATELTDRLTPSRLAEDRQLDVLGGTAGALLGALKLHRVGGADTALRAAMACGDRLLARRSVDPRTGLRGWATPDGHVHAGFGHGAAGIAYALAMLAEVTGMASYGVAAVEAFELVGSLQRRDGSAASTDDRGWSHGAAGIALAATALATAAPSIAAQLDSAMVDQAVAETAAAPLGPTDELRSGNLGRLDALLIAGSRPGDAQSADAARALVRSIIARAHRRGTFGAAPLDAAYTPDLLSGLAGIGYALLRAADPARLPSVLLLQ